jgi:glycosyltransferase involved in cell wall biosynthesis
MKIRVVDYVGNTGGGARFVVELAMALRCRYKGATLQFVSHGRALASYQSLLCDGSLAIDWLNVQPVRGARNTRERLWSIPGTGWPLRRLGLAAKWDYEVPEHVVRDCDLAWFPWLHRHLVPAVECSNVAATFHDAIIFQFDGLVPQSYRRAERVLTERWLKSSARLIVGSKTTAATAQALFGVPSDRFRVVPLSGEHAQAADAAALPAEWTWAKEPYLFYAANTSPHKNHDRLLQAVSLWGAKYPLVLSGLGTDLNDRGRGRALRALARSIGLKLGERLVPLGYVSDAIYYGLLEHCWALVMPSLAEGGGSFPVFEALERGIPVLCSDIPVMREWIEKRSGGQVIWFDPTSPRSLADALGWLDANYVGEKQRALAQVAGLRRRTWADVAAEYGEVFDTILGA